MVGGTNALAGPHNSDNNSLEGKGMNELSYY